MNFVMETMEKIPVWRRVNWRMVLLFGTMALAVGWVLFTLVNTALTGGIEKRGEWTHVDLKAMSNFEMDQVNGRTEDVPRIYRNLDGKKVVMEGEIYAPMEAGGKLTRFQLVYSIAKCCVTATPKVQHFVNSKMTPTGQVRLKYGDVVVRVYGTLHVKVTTERGRIGSVYQVDVDKIEGV
jgi:hypothetical protein